MRTRCIVLAALAALPCAATSARADGTTRYAVDFQEISSSCSDSPKRGKATLSLTARGDRVSVSVPQMPTMTGVLRKGGKLEAAARADKTVIKDASGKFSAAGRVSGRRIQLILVAEFYRGKKPLCTQTWDVSGALE